MSTHTHTHSHIHSHTHAHTRAHTRTHTHTQKTCGQAPCFLGKLRLHTHKRALPSPEATTAAAKSDVNNVADMLHNGCVKRVYRALIWTPVGAGNRQTHTKSATQSSHLTGLPHTHVCRGLDSGVYLFIQEAQSSRLTVFCRNKHASLHVHGEHGERHLSIAPTAHRVKGHVIQY